MSNASIFFDFSEVPFPGDIIESSLQFSKTVTDRTMVHSNRKNTRRARRRNAKSRVSIREDDHAVPVKVVQYYCTSLDQKLKTGFLSTSNSNREFLFSSFDTVESCSAASPEKADSLLDNRQTTKIRRSRRSKRRGNYGRSDILHLSYMLQPQSDFGSNQWFSMPIPECRNDSEKLNFIPSLPAANKLVPLSERDQCSLTNIASVDFCWKNEAYENHYADASSLPDNIIHEGTGATSASALNVKNSSIEEKDVPHFLVKRALESSYRKKLLVLDLNGILCDIVCGSNGSCLPHGKVNKRLVFKRPFLDDFLDFCFERFAVGIWSSRNKKNITGVINYVMGDSKDRLLFCWDQSKCTVTGFNTLENRHKPILLKELIKLWDNEEDSLPWEKGEYSPSNTLLVDDSPYKALCNPPYTGIFPFPYDFRDEDDNVLGPGGSIRTYLESIAMAADVQEHVKDHPLGQKAITSKDRMWNFYKNIINKNKSMALTPHCW